ncbi:ribbon-helix-helix protein, CopG family [Streptomonospora litoralis]|uniref:Antitoxin MazE6 n=1 Tax=Streptomonospora litoralis TaxID=2498135 RepID=A0A4P6Q602_9ACTN|nr:ribbon-helix-helix protein, CopG family [Streptomonospora litoralis]QBI55730.1 Antitoxin MazE6 [Streptomonospora litoralis]
MKTAISIPDEIFERVEQRAADLHVSRSEFFSRAAQSYLDELDSAELSRRIDEAIALSGEDDSNAAAAAAGRRSILDASGEW